MIKGEFHGDGSLPLNDSNAYNNNLNLIITPNPKLY